MHSTKVAKQNLFFLLTSFLVKVLKTDKLMKAELHPNDLIFFLIALLFNEL